MTRQTCWYMSRNVYFEIESISDRRLRHVDTVHSVGRDPLKYAWLVRQYPGSALQNCRQFDGMPSTGFRISVKADKQLKVYEDHLCPTVMLSVG